MLNPIVSKSVEFLKSHWKIITLVTVVFLAGAGLGWKLKPAAVEVQEKIVTKTVTQVVNHDVIHEVVRTEYVKVESKEVKDNSTKTVVTTRKPDGEVTTTVTVQNNVDTKTGTKTDTETNKNTSEDKVAKTDSSVDTTHTIITTPVMLQWHVGILLGAAPRFDAPALTPIMLGLEVEHRLAGPFFVGAWAMAGSPLTGFKVTNASLGVKLALEFP